MEPPPPPEPAPDALPAAAAEVAPPPHEAPRQAQAQAEASAAKPAARPRSGLAQTSLLLAGAAMLAAGVRALLKRRKRTPSDYGAIVSLLDVPGAPAPAPPSAPLPLAGLRFGVKDMCVRRRVSAARRRFCALLGARESLSACCWLRRSCGPFAPQLRRGGQCDGLRQPGLGAQPRARHGARACGGCAARCGRERHVQNRDGRARVQARTRRACSIATAARRAAARAAGERRCGALARFPPRRP